MIHSTSLSPAAAATTPDNLAQSRPIVGTSSVDVRRRFHIPADRLATKLAAGVFALCLVPLLYFQAETGGRSHIQTAAKGPTQNQHPSSDTPQVRPASDTVGVEPARRVEAEPDSQSGDTAPAVDGPARVERSADRLAETTQAVSLNVLTSPDHGEHCASGFDAAGLTEFFASPIGSFGGADYQRAVRLADDRVLWTFQDAFIDGTLVHNVGMVQSGRCFSMLNNGARSWLFGDQTSHMRKWHWILGGAINSDGTEIDVFVVEMTETGQTYLDKPRPTALRRVVLDASTLEVRGTFDEVSSDGDLYGWSVTSDNQHTYLYSHCYQQFGYDTLLGSNECVANVKLARIPLGRFDADREYWGHDGWDTDRSQAIAVVDFDFASSGNNPAQIHFDGERFVLVQKRNDWWGQTVEFGVAPKPAGPFVHVTSIGTPLACEPSICNSYFASWVPWTEPDGTPIWSLSHNRWNGSETADHLAHYRPTFWTVPDLDTGSVVPRLMGSRQ